MKLLKNKFSRLLISILFIFIWGPIYDYFFVEEIRDSLNLDRGESHFLLWVFFLIPIIFVNRYLWFEKSRNRTFFGLFDELKPTLKQYFKKFKINFKEFNTEVFGTISSADELKKYADLRDKGIISEEEFQAKKKKLLD